MNLLITYYWKNKEQNLREALEKTEIALQDFPEPSMNAGRYHRESINAILKLTKEQEYLTCSGMAYYECGEKTIYIFNELRELVYV